MLDRCVTWAGGRTLTISPLLPRTLHPLLTPFKKGKLRAHSDYMWNDAVNDWALSHWQWADIMVEAKCKNLASRQLLDRHIINTGGFTEMAA